MMRRFDGVRLGHLSASATDRAYPDIGLQAMTAKSLRKDESSGALFRNLKATTRSDHVEMERFVARLDLNKVKEYVLFLSVHYLALQNLRGDWREEDQKDFSSLLRCLEDDLKALGGEKLKLHPTARSPLVLGNRMGVSYAVRICRLTTRSERARVARGLPTASLDFVPALPWASFLHELERGADGAKTIGSEEVLRGARTAFELLVGLSRQARI